MERVEHGGVPSTIGILGHGRMNQDVIQNRLRSLFSNMPMADQIMLYRNYQDIPIICDRIWRRTHKRLDFRQLEQELSGEPLNYFLNNMMDHFRYVYFLADRLQDNLNVLERAGIKSLNYVQHCELLLSPVPGDKPNPMRQIDDGAGDAGLGRAIGIAAVLGGSMMPQWPLHALPKMMRNLRRLKVQCEVQVHFIEQFAHLELLVLYGDLAQSALTGILERCKDLKRLFIKCQKPPGSLQGITSCKNLQDISLPMPLFMQTNDLVLALPSLNLLELNINGETSSMIIENVRHVLESKGDSIDIVQMNCAFLEGPYWMREIGLGYCNRLQGLVLNNCNFYDREISEMNMPRVEKYLVLSSCSDLKEYQMLDIFKKCSRLSELYLIDCPQLTGKVLHGIYRIRCSEQLNYPLNIVLSDCDAVRHDYEDMYSDYWSYKMSTLKLDSLLEENRSIEDVQIFFKKVD